MKKYIPFAALAAVVMLLTGGCRGPKVPATHLQLSVNGEAYTIDLPCAEPVDLMTLSTEFDAEIAVANYKDFNQITVDGIALRRGEAKVPVPVIAPDAQLTLEWSSAGETGTVKLNTLHSKLPPVVASGKAASPGDFYLSYIFLRLVEKFDNAGNRLFYRYEARPLEEMNTSSGWWDFKKHEIDGKVYYSYQAPDPDYASWTFVGFNPGMRVILDEKYRKVQEIHLLAAPGIEAGWPTDGHEFILLGPDHYIVMSYIDREMEGKLLCAAYIQEVKDGQVVFDWWSTDHPEMAAMMDPCFAASAGKDYVHINAIDILPDGNWLCSFRHISTVAKIDRAGGTGRLLWTIEGRKLDPAYSFHGQHYARWHDDGTVTLFDNGNGHDPHVTRLLILKVDLATGAVSGGRNLVPGSYYAQACGALTLSGDNTIVGWGMPGDETCADRLLTEHDADGREVFGLRRPAANPFQLDILLASYRSVKSE